MRILDLFCGAGGAAMGYHRVFPDAEIVGVDINPQPRYPFTFVQGDFNASFVHWWTPAIRNQFDLVHASPPCQRYSAMSACRPGLADEYPDLVGAVRDVLVKAGVPYVIENVPGSPLVDPVTLCGQMFGLELYRHRLFETSFLIEQPEHPAHLIPASKAGHWKPGTIMSVAGHVSPIAKAREVMGIGWMNRAELGESIPPAYTEWVGQQFATSVAGTSSADAPQERHDTHHTTAPRCADGDVQPHTSHTAEFVGDPSGDNERATHRSGPQAASGPTVGQHSGATDATHHRGRHRGDGDRVRHHNVADLDDNVADLQFTEGLCGHALIQPQTHEGVNHK